MREPQIQESSKTSYFLKLPLEIRQEIFSYILPTTFKDKNHGIAWRRGHIALLAVNRQLNEECLDLMYGHSTFTIDVTYDSIRFRYQWVLPSLLCPNKRYPFLTCFPPHLLRLIKYYEISVEHVDGYTGMIKYNCQGPGLTDGLRAQVQKLVEVMVTAGELHRVKIYLSHGNKVLKQIRTVAVFAVERGKNAAVIQTVLDPFRSLKGVRQARVMGTDMQDDFARALEKQMMAHYS
ncbi:hypothetical protein M501DRAFT_1000623 [Patellaria atrata CBS 101060]|uniref:F-box domain-containing protein n=1 Tax=Patellaria atrata CBS 101060 TaxID=1346257 RepID=A0A9P4SFL4_9PEZI|nr:hypothetical protein M501DRAFT_1000623 [Patellaria atrata CBS 101060]